MTSFFEKNEEMKKSIGELLGQNLTHAKRIRQVEEQLILKEDRVEFQKLLKRFNVFQEIESMGALEDYYLPKIDKFCCAIDAFEASNLEMRECIIKFDKDISQKLSKSQMASFQLDLPNKFMSRADKEYFDEQLDNMKSLIWDKNQMVRDEVDSFVNSYQDRINAMV